MPDLYITLDLLLFTCPVKPAMPSNLFQIIFSSSFLKYLFYMRLFCIVKNVYHTELAGYLAAVKEDRGNRETLETFQKDRQVTIAVECTCT